jgi:hypothetical protein
MTEKVRKLSVFLQTLSRIPGLGFLADTERDLREAADQVDDVEDRYEDTQRQIRDIKKTGADVMSSKDEDQDE